MKQIFKIIASLFIGCGMLTSCGGNSESRHSESDGRYDDTEESSHHSGYTISFSTPHGVTAFLSNKTFKDANGNRYSFGSNASNVSFNGQGLGGAITVEDFGTDGDGAPYAIFSLSTPYGNLTFCLTELDDNYGGSSSSRIVIFDVNDPSDLFFKS